MSQEAKVQLSVLGMVVLLGTIAGLIMWNPVGTPDAGAQINNTAPVVIAANVTIAPPISGSTVKVTTSPASFESGTVDGDTTVWVMNATTGQTSPQLSHRTVKPLTHSILGSYGDLIRVEAVNVVNQTASTDVGFVPVPSDSAPPDVLESSVTGSYIPAPINEFHFSGSIGAIRDNSFPVTVTVTAENGPPASASIAGDGTESTVSRFGQTSPPQFTPSWST